jgi:hypothetical protein
MRVSGGTDPEYEEPADEDDLVSAETELLPDDFPLSLLLVAPAVFGDLDRVRKNLAIFRDLLLLGDFVGISGDMVTREGEVGGVRVR